MPSLAEKVAHIALAKFDSLPQKCKPRVLPDGRREWTPLSAVVLVREGCPEELTCVSLATGTKCLPATAIPKCQGLVLHDSHAEILALRGLNFFLLSEVQTMLGSPAYQSPYLTPAFEELQGKIQDSPNGPFNPPYRIKDNVSFHFFTTEAPCGDASMEILIESMPSHLASPWPIDHSTSNALQGRGHFSLLGHVRRKPARADAEASLSKSCTDKLAVKQFTSALAFPADLYIQKSSNAFIRSLVVPGNQYNSTGFERSFGPSGRLAKLHAFGNFFTFEPLPPTFPTFTFSKEEDASGGLAKTKSKASNVSAVWIDGANGEPDTIEVLVNGVKQGYKQWDERPNKASVVSRKELWTLAVKIDNSLNLQNVAEISGHSASMSCPSLPLIFIQKALNTPTYNDVKTSSLRESYRRDRERITDALGKWTQNTGDDFNLSFV